MKTGIRYYWNMYMPHRMLRRWASRKIYRWADARFGVGARSGQYPLTPEDREKLSEWHRWMKIKNKVGNPL